VIGIGESGASSYIAISSIASSSELPGSEEPISSSESRVDGEENSVGFLTGKSLEEGGSSSSSIVLSFGRSVLLLRAITWASSSKPDRPPWRRPCESYMLAYDGERFKRDMLEQ
jgi:hypothetical protein